MLVLVLVITLMVSVLLVLWFVLVVGLVLAQTRGIDSTSCQEMSRENIVVVVVVAVDAVVVDAGINTRSAPRRKAAAFTIGVVFRSAGALSIIGQILPASS